MKRFRVTLAARAFGTLACVYAVSLACTSKPYAPATAGATSAAEGGSGPSPATPAEEAWIPTWVSTQQPTSPENMPPAPGLAGATLRQIAQPALGGRRVRVGFSNRFGEGPLGLRAAHIAPAQGGAAISAAGASVTFDGQPSVIVQQGASVLSDPVDMPVRAFENLAVTAAFDALPQSVTGHAGSRTRSFLQPGVDVSAADLPGAVPVEHWYFLDRIDVWADARARAVVVLGDSITDGRGSTTDANNRWPNLLARRLLAEPATARVAVLNQGAGGNRVLRDGIGPNMLARFDRDVLSVPRARWLVVLAGINDIGTATGARARGEPAASARELIAAYRQMLARAHDHGMLVYGATLLPFEGFGAYYGPEAEADRQALNGWIRSGELDGVIDFDAAARDPGAPTRLAPAVDGGDHLHPSAAGYRIMADSVDLALFR
ncbi:MAG TPA: SGNH/GDSL hydrolase family protein [Polyangiaceae bacterium]|nr:SGNH/GDSL hydrolase family protein [Polyangiaceae bacterium]